MKAKKQIKIVILSILSILILIGAINFYMDPFGVFRKDGWFAYRMTRNPRTAKITYLNNKDNYDAYIVGSSGSSPLLTQSFNKYGKRNYYNAFYYGADMKDVKETVKYLVNKRGAKEIVLPITFSFAESYDTGDNDLHYKMKPEVDGKNKFEFYLNYLFSDMRYAYDMYKSSKKKSYIPSGFDVFIPANGNYDKRVRDTENIGSLENYLNLYPDFKFEKAKIETNYKDQFFSDLEDTVKFLQDKNVKLRLIMYPLYKTAFKAYPKADIDEFYKRLNKISDYWDFTYSSISLDPRYFYDTAHYRNDVGDMMIYKIFGDKEHFIPEDFGTFVKKGQDVRPQIAKKENFEGKILNLMLHHIGQDKNNPAIIDENKLIELFEKIKEKNYTTISLKDINDFVEKGKALPEKSILLTFDDGYKSNYTKVYPLLKKYNYKALYFPIGVSIGKDTYKESGIKIIPHYDLNQMEEMKNSKLVEFGSHTFDMHQVEKYEKENPDIHTSLLRQGDEKEYISYLKNDIKNFEEKMNGLMSPYKAMAYPLGLHDNLSDVIVKEKGYNITFTTNEGENIILKGLKQSTFSMNRINIGPETDLEQVLK